MKKKRLLLPQRARQIPLHWSWIDHRLVADRHLQRCSSDAWTLYLLLLSVGDSHGLSYYSLASIAARLGWDEGRVMSARRELVRGDFVAYEKPFYQVLELPSPESPIRSEGRRVDLGTVLREALNKIHTDQP